MSSNFSAMQDEDGKYNDWIEIYNTGNTAVNLAGYGLSDNESEKFKSKKTKMTLLAQAIMMSILSADTYLTPKRD